jgi:hypothetical protein
MVILLKDITEYSADPNVTHLNHVYKGRVPAF